ncbi:AraC family transcriptional regulator [Sulfurospirillum arcachonense]|uniref:AraC family transcriptional regulator n=1 Tax=Sulfurospirillum arcachonense TaxID=57666 RepID=UPI0004699A19|nr:AraC family transcriptional regulator [Sulfurospirillum arcachonense]
MNELFEQTRLDLVDFITNKFSKQENIETDISSLYLYMRFCQSEFLSIVYEPSICIVLQGSKSIDFGKALYRYSPTKYLLSSTHIPAKVRIEEATQEKPLVSLKLTFSIKQIYEVMKDIEDNTYQKRQTIDEGLFFDEFNNQLLDPISRLIKLLDTPKKNIDFLSPLIIKEILYVLLNGKSGDFLREYVMEGSTTNLVVKAITEIKSNFTKNLYIKDLSKKIGMSESSLYHNFKKLTMMSPLQFQKKIRLEEAKKIMLTQNINASNTAFLVGYESPSQFSREYSRMFGESPKAHIMRLKTNF